jgi:glutathione S-transferase
VFRSFSLAKKMTTLFSSTLSPFCSVVQVFLEYEGLGCKTIEVDPWRRTILQGVSAPGAVLPVLVFASGHQPVSKAQEIIDAIQTIHGPGKAGLFTNAMKNQCMRMNERVLPLVALNRHLTWASSHETVRFVGAGCLFIYLLA